MDMPVPIKDTLRSLLKQPIGAMVFIPDSGRAKRPADSIHGQAILLGGRKWITTRRTEGGFNVWKRREPDDVV